MKSSHNGWLSSDTKKADPNEETDDDKSDPNEETVDDETDPNEETDDDETDDYEMITLTPEPLCQELEELLIELDAQKKGKTLLF